MIREWACGRMCRRIPSSVAIAAALILTFCVARTNAQNEDTFNPESAKHAETIIHSGKIATNDPAPDTPVLVLFLYNRGFLNAAGVKALELSEDTKPPTGGRYVFIEGFIEGGAEPRAEPNPTILYQTIGALPQLSVDDQVNSTKQLYHDLASFGLASAVDAGGGGHVFPDDYIATKKLAEAGEMPLQWASLGHRPC